ncbi:CheR family methyltransferase [Fuchsiella alkaliacetigena]|uniref:CheR family methyltransferase n=1 Tax=Fuchsiella alkaliacetigena TaxID=957042 RepID=UPI00200B1F38|nr:protein-glutamate O-methyltransferase CheR [Fuchsiella alkaliacetigena]MCK8824817.1 protein-glutamate O-methyltransferase CheR [Fuchsiella alkaliacetigena]
MAEKTNKGRLSEAEFERIRRLVYDSIGVNLTDSKKPLIISRLSKRLRKLNLSTFDEYIDFLEKDSAELETMFNLITTNVTKFFREDHHFEYLKHSFLPKLEAEAQRSARKKSLRAWSAGCSTGEEPYSLAIVLKDYFAEQEDWQISILASDINTEVLREAQEGVYIQKKVEDIPYELLTKYFKLGTGPNQGLFKVKKSLRSLISFKQINLTSPEPYPIGEELDIIFCRNVFIYFNLQTQKRVLKRFYEHLAPGGLLMLGHSEKIDLMDEEAGDWRLVEATIYQRLP